MRTEHEKEEDAESEESEEPKRKYLSSAFTYTWIAGLFHQPLIKEGKRER